MKVSGDKDKVISTTFLTDSDSQSGPPIINVIYSDLDFNNKANPLEVMRAPSSLIAM